MNKKNLPYSTAALMICAALSVIAAAFRIVLTFTALDAHGVYKHGSIAPSVFHIALALFAAAFVICAFRFTPSRVDSYRHPTSEVSVFMSFVLGFLFIADAVMTIYSILKGNPALTRFDTLELIFSVPSAIYFLSSAAKPGHTSALTALFSLFPTAWCAVSLIRIYFDNELLMTDPGRILEEMALLSAMIAFLTESRAQLGKFSHRFFLAAATVAPLLLIASSVPNLILHSRLMIGTSGSLLRTALCLAFALFFLVRLAAYKAPVADDSDK